MKSAGLNMKDLSDEEERNAGDDNGTVE